MPPKDAKIAPQVTSQNESQSQNDTEDSSDIREVVALLTLLAACLIALTRQ
jgi:hypothetical protein